MSEASTAKSKANGGKHDLDAIRDDLDALRSDFGALLKHVKGGTVDGVTDEAKRLYGQLASQGEQSIETLTRRVEEKPLASVLISFGVGFILSRILSR